MHALEWASQCPSLEQVALMSTGRVQVGAGGEPVSVSGVRVPHDFFALFGVEPILGRSFLPQEDREGSDGVAILSESLWPRRAAGTSAIEALRCD